MKFLKLLLSLCSSLFIFLCILNPTWGQTRPVSHISRLQIRLTSATLVIEKNSCKMHISDNFSLRNSLLLQKAHQMDLG